MARPKARAQRISGPLRSGRAKRGASPPLGAVSDWIEPESAPKILILSHSRRKTGVHFFREML
jgi:hypothetical protein